MLEAFPFVPLGGHVRVGVAIFSYDGGINFGVTGDSDTRRDIDVLCRGIEAGVAELLGNRRRRRPRAGRTRVVRARAPDPTTGSSTAR